MIPDIHEAEEEGKKKSSQVNQDLQVMWAKVKIVKW